MAVCTDTGTMFDTLRAYLGAHIVRAHPVEGSGGQFGGGNMVVVDVHRGRIRTRVDGIQVTPTIV
jgi:hypothetical protein